MNFTEEDIKRIAKNIKIIRLAYGYKTQLDFAIALDPNARYPGLSHDMIKKYESGKYPITEQAVRLFASLTLFKFEEIVFDDLTELEPDSLVLDKEETIDAEDEEMLKDVAEDMGKIFPLFSNENSLKNEYFAIAMNICNTKLSIANFKEEDMLEAVNNFAKFDYPESYLNIMSLLGRLYATYIYCCLPEDSLNDIREKKYSDMLEYAKEIHKKIGYNEDFKKEIKRKYLDAYNRILTTCMVKAAKEDKHKDYVYYYLGIRYYFGIMDNDITKMSDIEMNSFGINMLDCLKIIGNKYAIEFKKVMKD